MQAADRVPNLLTYISHYGDNGKAPTRFLVKIVSRSGFATVDLVTTDPSIQGIRAAIQQHVGPHWITACHQTIEPF